MSIWSVLAAISVLAILIVVHETGHFLAARLQGIYANRFSVGFGPILWKYQGTQTEYALRAFPLGGFVGFPDDDPESEIPPNDPNLLGNRPILDRAIVISAGVIANLVFAYLILLIQFGLVGIPTGFDFKPGVVVQQIISENSPAAQSGIQVGDIILSVEGKELAASQEASSVLTKAIQNSPDQPLKFTIERNEQVISLPITPKLEQDGKGHIGVGLNPNGTIVRQRAKNVLEAFSSSAQEFQRIAVLTVQGFGQLISNFGETASQVAGPVKIVQVGANIAGKDLTALFQFAAIISINLAVINILPLPALDGGQLAFLIIEGLRGKPLPNEIQQNVMQTGLVLLLGLGIFLIVRDTANLLPSGWVQNLFQ
ncbi:MAG: RIP metalloprotease RseP [Coleofasciculaceae cyanobacterium]